jgi:hypothetical protein
MKIKALLAAAAALFATTALAPEAGATTFTLYIHGRTGGTPSGWGYWGHVNIYGVNPVPVNYDGTAHVWNSNPTVVAYLNSYCTNGNSCHIVCHSAGCAQIGYAMAAYNGGGWAIQDVASGGSAAGGSDIAGNLASFITGYALDSDLAVGTMRGLYNHDVVGDRIWGWVHTHLGADWAWFSNPFFSGNNDTAVSFHSSGMFRNSGSYSSASGSSTVGGTYWDWTTTQYVDPTICTSEGPWNWWCNTWSGTAGHCDVSSWDCYEGSYGGIMAIVANNYVNQNDH